MGRVGLLEEGGEEEGEEEVSGIITQRTCCVTEGREGRREGRSWSVCTREELLLREEAGREGWMNDPQEFD